MRFEFATAARVIFGPGVLREVGPLARGFGPRALVVTGANPQRAEPLLLLLFLVLQIRSYLPDSH